MEQAATDRQLLERDLRREMALRGEAEAKVQRLQEVVTLAATEAEVERGLVGSPLDNLAGKCQRCSQLEAELMRYRYRSLDSGAPLSPLGRGDASLDPRSRSRSSAKGSRSPPGFVTSGSVSRDRTETSDAEPVDVAQGAHALSTRQGSGHLAEWAHKSVCRYCGKAFAPMYLRKHEASCAHNTTRTPP